MSKLYGDNPLSITPGKVEVEREVYSLDKKLAMDIEDFISRQKKKGVMLHDVITDKEKRINKSLWVRKVLQAALEDEGYYREIEEEEKQRQEFDRLKKELTNMKRKQIQQAREEQQQK